MLFEYDIIVVGGGHAGCEAAAAAATMGCQTLLVTMDMTKFAQMSCNPAVGGVAKGQIVREIDALGGRMGIITDRSTIQFRMLNRSKGPAMWSPRAQCDKMRFSELWRETLENIPNLYLWQDSVNELLVANGHARGIKTRMGVEFNAKAVILTAGTFLGGLMHIGRSQAEGGRAGDAASHGLSEQLAALGFEVGRMKTGTPARLDARTIDFSQLNEQPGDENPGKFSYSPETKAVDKQKPCFLVYTSQEVHDLLRSGFADSPLFNGTIKGIGPRYCPSIEDKLRTFSEKNEHQLFLEPEGEHTNEYYLNGFSSSLPWQVQVAALQKIKGLEHVHIYRPGYAIEYDYFPPTQLYHSLETKLISGLYFAGQVNGTTGYEEAGAQGLIAGINAVLKLRDEEPLVLRRDESYIGVLIDDLVTKGVDEPYRMFTSRAEYRILLRQDNADVRLTPIGHKIGLVSEKRYRAMEQKKSSVESLISFLRRESVTPADLSEYFKTIDSTPLTQGRKLYDILLRNKVTLNGLADHLPGLQEYLTQNQCTEEIVEEAEIRIKYHGYIERERHIADKMVRLENISIRPDFDFNSLKALSIEARQKLTRIKPSTIGQASRIPGVSPADINVLLVYFGR
ncbi:tRNA uridine-5-carboxymethylaminomethyl(34) synthesis enzyme MnmG [Alistipes indistinctus]|jgi:tRNA uridine 5-carboxymethylaminomethyl modification enzyme|uniref:tRNA uridine 5-carboxymethylaminomethyl modification enzyme MnmG n=1 Tax=Alistipes indistinctus YIT 12060 TaxID=742725 RepID=G5H7U8_9BACT|nr:tRNA uridine-5-carboxymethylaminomethyl(34) synthesis enzyme MnmG [Alistipes indistinctus]EHB92547.1 tRNA uridine 5-carboxymethylaminomethyl modification enzyme GidA [Alistipes indistinctus YIT 12060]RGU36649.1 tRNA uridine-5-carboxymethylaminomethyl(34) synthesis enzyme MnmG [Alistipes indistinctus]UWN58585.1 tRNA uridine-5-carboxymethylaminomethyl(34) synthesis enzyme MnmG [Alistipes indistinctus YIT 12060]